MKNSNAHAAGERIAGPEEHPGVIAELIDVAAVSALGIGSPRHVYRLADAGKMPAPVKLGALVRWRRTEILNWIAAGCPPVGKPREAK
jgi:predicted DNA-binding transcriptional regulator AlpA